MCRRGSVLHVRVYVYVHARVCVHAQCGRGEGEGGGMLCAGAESCKVTEGMEGDTEP